MANPTKGKIYISGQISGIREVAPELFAQAAKFLSSEGWEPVNPYDIDHSGHEETWVAYMRADVKALCDCDAIYMLNNWKNSRGAQIERSIANHLEMEVYYQPPLTIEILG